MTDIIPIGGNIPASPGGGFSTDQLIEQYLADTQNIMETSKGRYRKSLKKYFAWVLSQSLSLNSITLTEILRYKQSLVDAKLPDGSSLSDITIGTYLVAVKGFYTWANAKGFPYNPAATLKSPKKDNKFKREYIPEDKLNSLFDYFEKTSIRNYTIAKTLYYCGLRRMELTRLNHEDIRFVEGQRVIFVHGKGRKSKDKWVKLTDKAFAVIEAYIQWKLQKYGNQCLVGDMPLFCSESSAWAGDRMTPGTVSELIKAGLRAIGIDDRKYTAHSIRHSSGTIAMLHGATKEEVKDMLRHASTATTEAYVHTLADKERLKNSAEDRL